MDPKATVRLFIGAVQDGDYDEAAQAEQNYDDWIAKGGFPAEATDGMSVVLRLDNEQDRVGIGSATHGIVEHWLDVWEEDPKDWR